MVTIYPSTALLSNTTILSCGTIHWMNPELIDMISFGSDGFPSRESDLYAQVEMTAYEVSAFRSFWRPLIYPSLSPWRSSAVPPFAIPFGCVCDTQRKRPGKALDASPFGFIDALWGLLQSCWSESASVRPSALQFLEYLRPASRARVPPKSCPTRKESSLFSVRINLGFRERPSLVQRVGCSDQYCVRSNLPS